MDSRSTKDITYIVLSNNEVSNRIGIGWSKLSVLPTVLHRKEWTRAPQRGRKLSGQTRYGSSRKSDKARAAVAIKAM